MQTIGTVLPGLHPRVFAWPGERGSAPTGAPFWKYNVVDMERGLEVEVGVPVAVTVDGDDQMLAACSRPVATRHSGTPAILTAWPARPRPCSSGRTSKT